MQGLVAVSMACLAVTAMVFLVGWINFMAEFHNTSSTMLQDLKRLGLNDHRTSVGKVLRSLTVIQIKMRNWYGVDKALVIVILDIIVGTTVDIMVANPV